MMQIFLADLSRDFAAMNAVSRKSLVLGLHL
jgi:hypothetical protein